MAQRKIKMVKERATKNKVLYVAEGAPGTIMDNMYIDQGGLREEGVRGFPDEITVTLEW